jgi:hypothetical protein
MAGGLKSARRVCYNFFAVIITLIDELQYRAYYLPRIKTILSIEPVDVPDSY